MAIAVASSSKQAFASNPTITITAPTGIQVGDLLVCVLFSTTNSPANLTKSGWTSRASDTTGGESINLLTRTADSADAAAGNFVFSISDSEICGAIMLRITGWDSSDTLAIASSNDDLNGDGIFSDLDLTPAVANSMIIFAVWQYNNGGSVAIDGYACVTSNPSWTEQQELAGGFNRGNAAIATAIRAQTTSTGDFSVNDNGGLYQAAILVVKPGAANYPITAAAGSFTLTSIATSLKIGKKMLGAVGAFTLTSIATGLKFGRKMLASLGTFTLTGVNAILLYGKYLLASLGQFTLTGVNVTITSTRKITADIGTFALTGINSILFVGHTITAATGAFVLTGINATITSIRTMTAALGQFVLTGINVAFPRASKIFALTGSFILSGANVAFSGARKIVAAVGTFTLTGVAALFPRASKIFALTGAFTLTGISARGLVNGVSILWTAASKSAVSTMANISKNAATWVNKLKS